MTKTKPKHTAGPWELTQDEDGIANEELDVRIVNELQGHLCSPDNLNKPEEESEANAHLITAAPGMYDFIREIADQGCQGIERGYDGAPCLPCKDKKIIAKAEGGS